jgi:tetratricopeptide (TPR) repeat protein
VSTPKEQRTTLMSRACTDIQTARHLEARAALRCQRWATASDIYAVLLANWSTSPRYDQERSNCCSLGSIDHIHREYCLVLLRTADAESTPESSSQRGASSVASSSVMEAKRRRATALSLCEHILRYRPQDVLSLLMMAEGMVALGQVEQAKLPTDIATRIMEYARATQILSSRGAAEAEELTHVLLAAGLWSVSQVLPNLARCYCQRGVILWRLGYKTEAIKSFAQGNRASVSDVEIADINFNLCASLWAAGLHERAAQRWLPHRGWELGQERRYYSDALARMLQAPPPLHGGGDDARGGSPGGHGGGQPHLLLDRVVLSWQCKR